MSHSTRAVIASEIKLHRNGMFHQEFKQLVIPDALLYKSHQYLDNYQIYKVLRYIVRPQTKEDMDKVLQVSVWPSDTFDLFEDNEKNIYAYYTKYQYSSIQYLKNLNRLLDMVQISEEFMPTYV
ncbi:MAG: hypothetical protein ACK56F_16565, partial [bacterium]